MFYLQRRATDIASTVSLVLLELIHKSGVGDANRRDRSIEELIDICDKVEAYQKFPAYLERNDPYVDFYEFFSHNASRINEMVEKLLTFSDVLSENQISILLEFEKDTNSPMSRNIKFSGGNLIRQQGYIPDSYAHVLSRMRKNANALLKSLGIEGTVC